VDKNWIKELSKHFEDPHVGGCGGHLKPIPPRTVIEEYVIFKDILSQERALEDEPISPPFLITANAMYRKKALEAVGGFDENFTVNGEDADLSWRIVWKGYKIQYEPEALVHHNHRSTLVGLLRQIKSYGSGASYLFWKHHDKLGYGGFFISAPYKEMIVSLFKIPFSLIFGKGKLKRILPVLDFLGACFFLTGKIATSIKLRIKYL
jgi:cellulose synthase/poly-beta-1,6-N-acetylglucosamine synthase-like glycosyltransferase